MRIGAHESVAGGLHLVFARAEADGCEALQLFSSYNLRWGARPFDDVEASLFRSEAARLGWPLLAHAAYLINLASPDPSLWQRSVEALHQDLLRCETLGIDALVLHPGSPVGSGEGAGLRRVSRALGELHRRAPGLRCRLLLENTAGQGETLGHRFEQLGQLLAQTHRGDRLGVCIDTCHAFAAGYDLATAGGYDATLRVLQRTVGLESVGAFHLNDSKTPLGSRRDRHASIGEGHLGRRAFARLLRDRRFAGLPAVVETPAHPDGSSSFPRNIRRLKRLRGRPQ